MRSGAVLVVAKRAVAMETVRIVRVEARLEHLRRR